MLPWLGTISSSNWLYIAIIFFRLYSISILKCFVKKKLFVFVSNNFYKQLKLLKTIFTVSLKLKLQGVFLSNICIFKYTLCKLMVV